MQQLPNKQTNKTNNSFTNTVNNATTEYDIII